MIVNLWRLLRTYIPITRVSRTVHITVAMLDPLTLESRRKRVRLCCIPLCIPRVSRTFRTHIVRLSCIHHCAYSAYIELNSRLSSVLYTTHIHHAYSRMHSVHIAHAYRAYITYVPHIQRTLAHTVHAYRACIHGTAHTYRVYSTRILISCIEHMHTYRAYRTNICIPRIQHAHTARAAHTLRAYSTCISHTKHTHTGHTAHTYRAHSTP